MQWVLSKWKKQKHVMANIKWIHNEVLLQNILTDSGNDDDFWIKLAIFQPVWYEITRDFH